MKVRSRVLPSGAEIYFLDYGRVEGRRKREYFGGDLEAAERALKRAVLARQKLGQLGVSATSVEMAEYLTLKERVEESGATVHEAMDFFLKHGAARPQPMLLNLMVEAWVDACDEAGLGQRTLESYRSTVRSLARCFPGKLAQDLTREDVMHWLSLQGWEGATKNKRLGYLRTCFGWARARERRHMQVDVLAEVKTFAVKEAEEIETLPLAQCEALLRGALKQPEMMGYVVLGLFGGIRRAELERLRWESVDLEERTVLIGAKQAKGTKTQRKNRRIVDLTAEAVLWIQAALKKSDALLVRLENNGRVAPTDLTRKWPAFWAACGLPAWPQNALRHTFASMHYAHHQNAQMLQAQMGHGLDSTMLHQHYRALKTRKEAALFWALVP